MKIKYMAVCILVVILAGCGNKPTVPNPEEGTVSPQIGISFDSLVIERWQTERDVFTSTVKELGGDVYVQNANGDIKKQIDQIEYFIDKKVDVIVVLAADSNAITNAVKKAKSKGIAVIAYDRLIKNADVDLYISFDNEMVGKLTAQSIIDDVKPKGNIVALFGSPQDNNVTLVEKGFNEEMEKSDLNIIYKSYCPGWISEQAFTDISTCLEKGEQIDGIYCGNDGMAGQAIKALSEYRLAGSIPVVGQDADLAACQRIVEGTQSATIYKDIIKLSKKAAQYAVNLAEGKDIYAPETFNDGQYDVPYYGLSPVLVDKNNMDKIIVDKFHLKDDVYLNVEKR